MLPFFRSKCLRVTRVLITGFMLLSVPRVSPAAAAAQEPTRSEVEEFDFANGLFSRGMFDMAVDVYKDFLKKYPESAYSEKALYRIAEAYFLAGRYEQAMNRFGDFSEKYPEGELSLRAELRKGQSYYFDGDAVSAEKVFSGLAGRDPSGPSGRGARYYLAVLKVKNNDLEGAREILEKMLQGDGGGEYAAFSWLTLGDIYRKQQQTEQALLAYSRSVELASTSAIRDQASIRKAGVYFDRKKFSDAASLFRETMVSTESPKNASRAAEGLFLSLYSAEDHQKLTAELPEVLERISAPETRARILFLAGSSYFNRDDLENALRMYSQARADYPETSSGKKAVLNRCWTLYRMGRGEECLEEIDEYCKFPGADKDEAFFLKSKILSGMGRVREAIVMLSGIYESTGSERLRKESLYQKSALESMAGDDEAAAVDFLAFAEQYPDDKRSPTLLLKVAQTRARKDDHAGAIDIYDRFSSRYSESALYEDVLFQSARAYQQNNQYGKAIETYGKFIERYPGSEHAAAARYWTGRAYQSTEQWSRAIETFSSIVASGATDNYVPSLESLGFSYFESGNDEMAAETYFRLISEVPERKMTESVYAWVADHYLLKGDTEKASKTINTYLSLSSGDDPGPGILLLYGRILSLEGNTADAEEYFKKIVEQQAPSPYLENAYTELGDIAYSGDRLDEAIEYYNDALEVHTDDASGARARIGMADVYYKRMELEEAAKQYMMVAILYDDPRITPRALYKAAQAFERTGKTKKAVEVLNELIEKYPGSEPGNLAVSELKRMTDETR